MTGSAVELRSTLDLSRAPDAQWNDEMLQMVNAQLFRGRELSKGALYYCLAVADGLALNPLIGEIYFIPSKSQDGKGPALQPYIGRNGLVKKARERRTYFEADVVHENDRFRIVRKADGTRTCTHSYAAKDRGEIVGAYAFLHDDDGGRTPAFFYAKLDEYLPSFDAEWKMEKSPWGNQRTAMITKCAMIGAGRERLDLGNVLMDGELPSYEQQRELGPGGGETAAPAEFDWSSLDASPEAIERLRDAVSRAREVEEGAWGAAKLEMVVAGMSEEELAELAGQIDAEASAAAEVAASGPADAGGPEEVVDAVVVTEGSLDVLRAQERDLERRLESAQPASREFSELTAELDRVQAEIGAIDNPDQESLLDGNGGR